MTQTIDLSGRVFEYEKEKWEPTYEWNSELAHTILDIIRANPKLWNQGMWAQTQTIPTEEEAGDLAVNQASTELCGTAMCFAGWAVELEVGIDWLELPGRGIYAAPVGSGFDVEDSWVEAVQTWSSAGRGLLGLTEEESGVFFAGDNSLHTLEGLVAAKDSGDPITWDLRDCLRQEERANW